MAKVTVRNMVSNSGREVANQFVICVSTPKSTTQIFQSYNSAIVQEKNGKITLDKRFWDYSVTTGRYRNEFLGETKKETQAKIDSGEYKLGNLN